MLAEDARLTARAAQEWTTAWVFHVMFDDSSQIIDLDGFYMGELVDIACNDLQ